jgi:tyrosine-protein kinase Etk/Wzc
MTARNSILDAPETATTGISSAEALRRDYKTSLIDLLTQLALRKRLIAQVMGIAILSGLVLCFVLPVRYSATAKIMPPQQTPSTAALLMNQLAGGGGNSLAALAGSGLSLKNPNDIYIGLLTSRPIADAIIDKFGLANVYRAKNMTQARKKLAEYTEVTGEKDGFISISVTDRDKERAAEMANAYTAQLRLLTKSLAVTEASQRRLFYEDQLKQAGEALVASELAFQQIQQQKGLVQLDAQTKAMIEGLAELHAQVAAKEVEVQALRSYSTEKNPNLQLAEQQLSSLEGEETRLNQSNGSKGVGGLGLEDVPGAGLEYLRAAHELQYRQALSDMLMKQLDAARLDESKDAAVIQVVEPAIEPDQKSSPERARILLQFVIAGFLVGCFLALFPWWKALLHADPDRSRKLLELNCVLKGKRATHG